MPCLMMALAGSLWAATPATQTAPAFSSAPLRPTDLALVFNTLVPESRELAEYYAARRGVPPDRLIGLRLSTKETIPRTELASVRRQLRHALAEAGIADHVRCLVTFYGVPLRVGPFTPGPTERATAERIERELADLCDGIDRQSAALEATAGASPAPASRPTGVTAAALKRVADRYEQAKLALATRIEQEHSDDRRHELLQALIGGVERVEGVTGILAHIRPRPGQAHPLALRRLEVLRDEAAEGQRRMAALLRSPPDSPDRREARELVRRLQGLLGLLRLLHDDREALLGRDTAAALDSELALLWWEEYSPFRWQPNPLAWRVRAGRAWRADASAPEPARPTLMGARLDGPGPAVVRRMIDDAIEAERSGLQGVFYIDARGLQADPTAGSYGNYDQDLRDLAALLKERTSWPTVLDDRPELFGPGQAPRAALYCGWYSLRKYVPAFTFVRGAVGYHIASAEAVSLQGRAEQGWCKRMLEEGAAATLGPVEEPYLHAFPRPTEFFGLLLTGRFTLAEVFAYTSPLNSWMLTLLGDPLYRPFGDRPVLRLDEAIPADLIPPEFRAPPTLPAGRAPGQSRPGSGRGGSRGEALNSACGSGFGCFDRGRYDVLLDPPPGSPLADELAALVSWNDVDVLKARLADHLLHPVDPLGPGHASGDHGPVASNGLGQLRPCDHVRDRQSSPRP